MSTSEQSRTAAHRRSVADEGPAAVAEKSSLREDLEAVWAISASDGSGAGVESVVAFAAAIVQQAAERSAAEQLVEEAVGVVALVCEIAGMSEVAARRALFRHASSRLALLGRDPSATLATLLRLLAMLAPVKAASVWLRTPGGNVELGAAAGALAATRRCKVAALEATRGGEAPPPLHPSRVQVHAYPLERAGHREGALVVRVAAETYLTALPFLEEFALVFAAVSEREQLLRASSSDERRLGAAYERRLMRTALDLHDGPLQDLAALATELQHLRSQVCEGGALPPDALAGRIDDASSRLVELDRSLRAIVHSLETATVAERPLAEALRREADSFARRSGATVNIAASGGFEDLSMSQRIAVLRIVQEALANAREHSGATHVDLSVVAAEEGLSLRVADNGRGFDLQATAAAAARRGRLGIVGMNERVRLLGGVFSLESVPGVGTTVAAWIPAWRPLASADS